MRTPVVLVASFLAASCANSPGNKAQDMPPVAQWQKWTPKDGKRGFEHFVLARTGAGATSCGRFPGAPYSEERRVPGKELAEIAGCIDRSRDRKEPFFFVVEGSAVDSWVATGLLEKRDGAVEVFWYDSAPCGGPHCNESFSTYPCPAAKAAARLDPLIQCEDFEMRGVAKK